MNKKMTAVEWHSDAVIKIYNACIFNQLNKEEFLQNLLNARLQAKAMEKEQIESAWDSAYYGDACHDGEQYYKKTYEQNESRTKKKTR